jgi:hypothetical protein
VVAPMMNLSLWRHGNRYQLARITFPPAPITG